MKITRNMLVAAGLMALVLAATAGAQVKVPAGTEVKVAFKQDVSSKFLEPGEEVPVELVEPLQLGGVTLVKAGALGRAAVKSVKPAGKPGKGGSIVMELIGIDPEGHYESMNDQKLLLETDEGVLQAKIPWGFVIAGAGLGAIVELLRLPSLPFAVGLYLPVSTMTPIFVGGCIRRFIEKKHQHDQAQLTQRRERGILFGSGLIAGEGLLGVGIALYAFFLGKPEGVGRILSGTPGDVLSLAIFAMLGYTLFRRTR